MGSGQCHDKVNLRVLPTKVTTIRSMRIMNNQISFRCTQDLYGLLEIASENMEIKKSELIRLILKQWQMRVESIFEQGPNDE